MSTQIKVLCVDDNKDTANSTAVLLRDAGFEARACHNGPEALTVAETFRPDVCLIDLAMPGMPGDELAERLREQAGPQPLRCIALTGSWDVASRHRTHNARFEEHLVKPVEPERLIAAIRGPQTETPAPGS
jgi:CheY-like chemotaxis protein